MRRISIFSALLSLAVLTARAMRADDTAAPPSKAASLATNGDGTPLSTRMPKGSPDKDWTADNGNGTYSNPLFNEEFEDPDPIRVGNDYYLASTTMHMMPAVIIMHSKDLVNWEPASYCADALDPVADTAQPGRDPYRLENGDIYGKGIWAPCIRYHNGMFYVFCNVNGAALQIYRAKSAFGPWEHTQLTGADGRPAGRHDLSVLFDDDLGKIFLISGNANPYSIDELSPDATSVLPNARHQLAVPAGGTRMGEGHHLYKIKGKYYDVSAIPGGPVNQVVAKADSIDGPWTVTTMVDGETLGTPSTTPARAQPGDRGLWLHQGGMCDTPSGEWWSIIMSDHGSAGRTVALVPITWDDDFPLIGLPGNLRKAPNTWIKPNTGANEPPAPTFVHDDDFNSGVLNPLWQWNHVEDDSKWSLTEKPGVLRLHSLPADDFYHARDTLCQRPPAPESIMTVELDTAGLQNGDNAGLGLLSTPYAWIGVVKTADGKPRLPGSAGNHAGGNRGGGGGGGRGRGGRGGRGGAPASAPASAPGAGAIGPVLRDAGSTFFTAAPGGAPGGGRGFGGRGGGGGGNAPAITKSDQAPPAHVWLRVHCNFDTDQAVFSWSADGKEFKDLGNPFTTTFQLTTFQGVRPSLFNFNTTGSPGGYADFDNYTVDEPRARGIEREIPIGKTIALSSGADGAFLAADLQNATLVDVAADAGGAIPATAKFQVIDVGLGRVAFKASDGRFVSAASPGSVVLKDLGGAKPGDAESFQWINLLRGDTMFMCLTNHQYLATKPNNPGPVTANALGASPARKSGAEFKWKTLD